MATSPNWRSRSTRATRWPRAARPAARFVERKVLPVPPLVLNTTMRLACCTSSRCPAPASPSSMLRFAWLTCTAPSTAAKSSFFSTGTWSMSLAPARRAFRKSSGAGFFATRRTLTPEARATISWATEKPSVGGRSSPTIATSGRASSAKRIASSDWAVTRPNGPALVRAERLLEALSDAFVAHGKQQGHLAQVRVGACAVSAHVTALHAVLTHFARSSFLGELIQEEASRRLHLVLVGGRDLGKPKRTALGRQHELLGVG